MSDALRKDTRRQPTLFAMPPKPRRVLLRVADAGSHGCVTSFRYFVHLVCDRCGHDAGWSEHRTKKEATSQPCPVCNAPAATEGERADG
ncbi:MULTISPECIES: hypothetical protein [unclassified Azospirillum]|uniref:hypothetical protein n=1 Tax=unclassified Azospirillum TaxID=2630922 RepID=UPI000D64180A|nr:MULTISPECIES: hypothetical protein [unclassified Azospirillum]